VRPGPSARAAAGLLSAYKRRVSPLLPRSCRYAPTCSEYARLAILKHGLARGAARSTWRLLRCQPLGAGGIDLP
jgi:putative membrane protein insertion efficiency factor